jgi:hypothetical protein
MLGLSIIVMPGFGCHHSKSTYPGSQSTDDVRFGAHTPSDAVAQQECYALHYTDAVADASERLFPVWIMLMPGGAAGNATGRHHPSLSDRDWAALWSSGWKRISSDSLEIVFTGNYEGIKIHAERTPDKLRGRAIWLTDLVGRPEASMALAGDRVECPDTVPPSR